MVVVMRVKTVTTDGAKKRGHIIGSDKIKKRLDLKELNLTNNMSLDKRV